MTIALHQLEPEGYMKKRIITLIAILTVFACSIVWGQTKGEYAPQSAMEMKMLPSWCWGYYKRELGPKHRIDTKTCGPGMTHYCGAIVLYNRSHMELSARTRARQLRRALYQTDYTIHQMEKFPACGLRRHVAKMKYILQRDIAVVSVAAAQEKANQRKKLK